MTKPRTCATRQVSSGVPNSTSAVAMASSSCCSLVLSRGLKLRTSRQNRTGQTLVPLIIVQFVINCFLALVLNHQHQTTSLAIPIEAALGRQNVQSGAHLQQRHRFHKDHTRSATGHGGQRRASRTPASLPLHRSFSSESLYDESTINELDRGSTNFYRPRWRLNPVSGATSARLVPERARNRVLTIEDDEEVTRNMHASEHGLTGDVTTSDGDVIGDDDDEKRQSLAESTGITGESKFRGRRHEQPQAAGDNLNEHQRQQIKTRASIQRAEQAYRNKLMELKQRYLTNRAITDKAYYILLIIYAILITFGTISNSLICLTVIFKPKILSPRNIFIVNLAGSDLLLCVFTMPLTFIEVSMKIWQMGLIPCKLVAGLQATSIFVSTISITAIALDRYKVIVYPTHQEAASGTRGAFLLLASVWIGALSLSLPLFTYRTVEHHEITSPQIQSDSFQVRSSNGATAATVASSQTPQSALTPATKYHNGSTADGGTTFTPLTQPTTATTTTPLLVTTPTGSTNSIKQYPNQLVDSFDFCIEAWPFAHGRGIFSVISMILQYVLPITIVSFVYTKISRKLQKRLIRRQRLTQLECQQKRQLNLIKRTHTMLVSVSLVFGLSWLPLNLMNVASDFSPEFRQFFDDQTFRIIFAICHLIGCSSACSNPIFYGFLNENFRKEFHQVYNHHARIVMRRLRRLAEMLNCCWLTRKVFQLCFGSRIDLRAGDDDEEDDDDFDGYVARRASNHTGHARDKPANKRRLSNESISLAYQDDDDDDDDDAFSSSLNTNCMKNGDNSSLASGFTSGSSMATSWSGGSSNGAWRKSAARHLSSLNVIPLSTLRVNNSEPNLTAKPNNCNNNNNNKADNDDNKNGQLEAAGQTQRHSVAAPGVCPTNNQQQPPNAASPQADVRLTMTGEDQQIELANEKTTDDDKRRRLSYQTVTSVSGRNTLGGRTMRLCLCLSSSSSAETLGGMAPPSMATANGLEQSVAGAATPPKQASGPGQLANSASLQVIINDGSGVGERVRSDGARGQDERTAAVASDEADDERRRRRQHRRRRRQRMRQRLVQLECECQCHKSAELADQVTVTTRPNAQISPGQTLNNAPAQCQTTFTGRRVWLRFLGAGGENEADDGQPQPAAPVSSPIDGDNERNNELIVARDWQTRPTRPSSLLPPPPPSNKRLTDGVGLEQAERSDTSRVLHKSQPDLACMRPDEHEHGRNKGRASCGATIDLADNNKQKSTHERNRSSGTEPAAGQIFDSRRKQHCNNCKHSSVLSVARLAAASSNQRRSAGKHQRHQRHQRHHKRPGGPTKLDETAAASALETTGKQRAPAACANPAATRVDTATAAAPKKRPLSISSWMTNLRRRKSASSNHEASQPSSSSSRRNSNQLTRQRSGGAAGFRQEPPVVLVGSGASKSSAANSPLPAGNSSPKQSSSTSSRNNSQHHHHHHHHQQQQHNQLGAAGKNASRLAFASGVSSAKQVGTVYLSIETADRKRADSVFSFDGGHEKSTSVVVMLADEEDDLDQLDEPRRAQLDQSGGRGEHGFANEAANSELAGGDGGVYKGAPEDKTTASGSMTTMATSASHCHGGAFNSNQRQATESAGSKVGTGRRGCCGSNLGRDDEHRSPKAAVRLPTEPQKDAKFNNATDEGNQINIATDYASNQNEAEHTRCQAQQITRQSVKTASDCARGATKLPTATSAATKQGDNFIDCRPSSECRTLGAGGPEARKAFAQLNYSNRGRAELAPSQGQHDDMQSADLSREGRRQTKSGPNTTTSTPTTTTTVAQTIDSSGSSGSVSISGSQSAYSFTSACLLNHSSSMSSCTCSLTASSFSSGQLNATSATTTTTTTTTTTNTTNHESSMSTSAPATTGAHHHQHRHQQHHLGVVGGPHQRAGSINLSPLAGRDHATATNMSPTSFLMACRHNELTLDESLARHDQLVGATSQAATLGPAKRHQQRNQHQLQLRQLRTHSATLGCERGRSARVAAAGAALAAAHQRAAAGAATPFKLGDAGASGSAINRHQREHMQDRQQPRLGSQAKGACSRSLAALTPTATTVAGLAGQTDPSATAASIMAPNLSADQSDAAADCGKWPGSASGQDFDEGHRSCGSSQPAMNRASLLLSSSQSAQMAAVVGSNRAVTGTDTAASSSSLFSAGTNAGTTATKSDNNNNTAGQVSSASSTGELAKIEDELMMMTEDTSKEVTPDELCM